MQGMLNEALSLAKGSMANLDEGIGQASSSESV